MDNIGGGESVVTSNLPPAVTGTSSRATFVTPQQVDSPSQAKAMHDDVLGAWGRGEGQGSFQ